MRTLPVIHFDCTYFKGDRPCMPNKSYGVFCGNCTLYEKNETITDEFPDIPSPGLEESTDGFKKIIIVKLDAVGDVLRTTSILPSIHNKYHDASVTWITKEKSFDVLKDNEAIDEIYFDSDDLEHIYSDDFDIAINLDSGTESCKIMSRLIAKELFGFHLVNGKPFPLNNLANEWYLMGIDDNIKKQNTKTYHKIIHEICNLNYSGTQPQIGITQGNKKRAGELNSKYLLGKYSEFIIINLGGGNRWQYKKWTINGYISLINKLLAIKPEAAVGIIAGDEDRQFYNEISVLTEQNQRFLKLGCDNSVDDLKCFIYLADKVFTSDSLVMHIATSLNKYTVVFTGPTSFTELDVFGNGAIIHSNEVDCLGCYLNRCDKTVNCMNTLYTEDIIKFL